MAKSNQTNDAKHDPKAHARQNHTHHSEEQIAATSADSLPAGMLFSNHDEGQINLLRHPDISPIQRQQIVTQIGNVQGNRHVQLLLDLTAETTAAQPDRVKQSNGVAPPMIQRDEGTVETSEGTQAIEGSQVAGNNANFASDCQAGLREASTRVRTHINAFGVEILHAISAFKDYSDAKIDDLEGAVTGQDMLNSLIGIALDAIPIPGAGRLVRALGTELGGAIISELRSRLTSAAQDAANLSQDASGLRTAVTNLVAAARDSSTAMRNRAGTEFDAMVSPIITKIQNSEELNSAENETVQMFYQARPDMMDQYLANDFGIPVADDLVDLHVNLFSGLVRGFEREVFSATATLREQIYWTTASQGTSGQEGYARHQAEQASQSRRRQLESADDQ